MFSHTSSSSRKTLSWFSEQLEKLIKEVEAKTLINDPAAGENELTLEGQLITNAIEDLIEIENKFNEEKLTLINQLDQVQIAIINLKKSMHPLTIELSTSKKNKKKIEENIKTIEEKIQTLTKKYDQLNQEVNKKLLELIDDTKRQMLTELVIEDVDANNEFLIKLKNLVAAYDPVTLSFNSLDSETFDILEQHIASNKEDAEGIYARTQQNSRAATNKSEKYNLDNLENKFQNNIKGLIQKDKYALIGANNTRVNSVYTYSSSILSADKRPITQSHKSFLNIKDAILNHKNNIVKIMVNNMQDKKLTHLRINKNQLNAFYPCLMIQFVNPPIGKKNDIIEAYSEFVSHLMIAKINAILKARGLTPLIDRRQSFGFLTPTLTDTHTAIRLSLGLTPHINWVEAVQDGIIACDKILSKLHFKEQTKKGDIDYISLDQYTGGNLTGYAHKYLEEITGGIYTITAIQDAGKFNQIIHQGLAENELYIFLTQDGFYYITNQTNQPEWVKSSKINIKNYKENFYDAAIIEEAAKRKHFANWDDIQFDSDNLIKDINFIGLNLIQTKNKKNNVPDLKVQSCEIFKMESIPENLTPYRGKYLLLNSADGRDLYYISYHRKVKKLDILNKEMFETKIVNPMIYNKEDKITSLVVSNEVIKVVAGVIHPTDEVAANIIFDINPHDTIHKEYKQLYEKVDGVLTTLARFSAEHQEENQQDIVMANDTNEIIAKKTNDLITKTNSVGSDFFTKRRDLITYDTSDDDEASVDQHVESKKNYRTPWGMSAIFSPMEALRRAMIEKKQISEEEAYPLTYECVDYSYFEINLNWNGALLNSHFIRADRVKHYLINTVMKNLFDELRINPFSCSVGGELLTIDNDKFDQDIFKDFVYKYIKDMSQSTYSSYHTIDKARQLLKIMRSTLSPHISAEHAELFLHKLHYSITQSVAAYCNKKLLYNFLANTAHTDVVHIDVNPCVNRDAEVITCIDWIKKFSEQANPPKLLIIDTTSTTQEQLKEIVKVFDKQDTIPLLVTAMSGLKNSQLGLDCFPYGENKIYISRKFLLNNEDKADFCDMFSKHLKDITRGTEIGVSRLARRALSSSANFNEMNQSPKKNK